MILLIIAAMTLIHGAFYPLYRLNNPEVNLWEFVTFVYLFKWIFKN